MTNWIDQSCMFASSLSEAQLKSLQGPDALKTLGFVCSNSPNFDNADLPSVFTGNLGLLFNLLNSAPTNADFFNCLSESFLCQWFADRFDSATVVNNSTGGVLSYTVPAAWGTALVFRDMTIMPDDGGNAIQNFTNIQGIFLDSGDNVTIGSAVSELAGGDVVSFNINNDSLAILSVLAIRTDCP